MEREVISIENGKVFIPANTEIWMTQYDAMLCSQSQRKYSLHS